MICKECNKEVRETDVKAHLDWGCTQESLFTFKPSGTFVTASAAPGTTYQLAGSSWNATYSAPAHTIQNCVFINSQDREEPMISVDNGNVTMTDLFVADQDVTFDELVRHTMGTRQYKLVRGILVTVGLFACYGVYKVAMRR